ncbi:unnamed protein product [Gadus morhua 'NCC']
MCVRVCVCVHVYMCVCVCACPPESSSLPSLLMAGLRQSRGCQSDIYGPRCGEAGMLQTWQGGGRTTRRLGFVQHPRA